MTTTDETPERLLSSVDLADRWQVSTRTIKRMTDRREIHFIRVGKQIRFKLADVLAYEKKRRS
jgi:excisionase family DNA binding protein